MNRFLFCCLLLTGCSTVESEDIFTPRQPLLQDVQTEAVVDEEPVTDDEVASPETEGDEIFGVDPTEQLGDVQVVDETLDPLLVAASMGLTVPPVQETPAGAQDIERRDSIWAPNDSTPGSWGVNLVSTISDAQPPRAILSFPDGREEVVKAGTMLPEAKLIILAIGRDVVQIAEIKPEGDRARVVTRQLHAFHPSTGKSE